MAAETKSVKQMIREAFVELMAQKPYLEITVTDIVRKAGVARASFYRNYDSIGQILDEITEGIAAELSDEVLCVLTGNDQRKWRELLFELFYRLPKLRFVGASRNYENAGIWYSRMNAILQRLQKEMPASTLQEKYAPFGKIGLVVNIIKKWLDTGMQESPEEMVNYIMSFITQF